jgi:hypothetical protein
MRERPTSRPMLEAALAIIRSVGVALAGVSDVRAFEAGARLVPPSAVPGREAIRRLHAEKW